MNPNHWNPDGTCPCPITGNCHECGKPCTDHDIVGNGDPIAEYWCNECINRSWERYERNKAIAEGRNEG